MALPASSEDEMLMNMMNNFSDSEDDDGEAPAKAHWPKVPKHLTKLAGKAIQDYDMIKEGDRVLIGRVTHYKGGNIT